MLIKGTVSSFQQRTEQLSTSSGVRLNIVWNFRIERFDDAKRSLPRVAVQMSGVRFLGSITNGDVVEIDAPYVEGRVVVTNQVKNLTAGSMVEAAQMRPLWLTPRFYLAIIAMLAFFTFFFIAVLSILQSFSSF